MQMSAQDLRKNAHSLSEPELMRILKTSQNGLGIENVENARTAYGSNFILLRKEEGPLDMIYRQFNAITFMLIFAAIVAFVIGHTLDAIGILAAAFLSIFFGFVQEYKAEEALKSLYALSAPKATVLRNAKAQKIGAKELVCGDIILLEEGDLVPADCRLIQGDSLLADQSILTGESHASIKHTGTIATITSLAERSNILYSGTLITKGSGTALVFAVGKNSEFGSIASRLSQVENEKTPLQKNLDELGDKISKASTLLVFLFFIAGMLNKQPLTDMLLVSISLFVAAVPEGLPTVLAITLAIGVSRMAAEKAIVRRMQSVETMGAVSVICTDKTGTITANKMALVKFNCAGTEFVSSGKNEFLGYGKQNTHAEKALEHRLLSYASLCSSASVIFSKDGKIEHAKGDATEVAILSAANYTGINLHRLYSEQKLLAEYAFDYKKKRACHVRLHGKEAFSYMKGAPEVVFAHCTHILDHNGVPRKMDASDKAHVEGVVHSYASGALRTLAVAYKPVAKKENYPRDYCESGMIFAGVLGFIDPPRPEVKEALRLCQKAGIRVVMLTGDSHITAVAIAKELGLPSGEADVLTGEQIEKMHDNELREKVRTLCVLARATPEHKFRIISALQLNGEVVAVTGDGVNDAPSIKKADIGIAMGIGGTDVARGAADMVLTDNNFGTLVKAIEKGRSIFDNIVSFVRFQLTTNVAALSLMFISPLMGLPLPLRPLQILWINIIMDGPPALALGMEPAKENVMERPPRDVNESILNRKILSTIFISAALIFFATLFVYIYYLQFFPQKAGTIAFCLFVFLQLANSLNCRSLKLSALKDILSNKPLVAALLFSLIAQISIIYIPSLQELFATVPLDIADWLIVFGMAIGLMLLGDARKKMPLLLGKKAQT